MQRRQTSSYENSQLPQCQTVMHVGRPLYPSNPKSQCQSYRMHGAGQGRSPTSAESGVAWTLLREEPPGGQAMDLPRGEWRTSILAGEAGGRLCPVLVQCMVHCLGGRFGFMVITSHA